ncbi:PAS domain S-box protein [Motiliproteus sp. MSK22-1]|uniref:PAS domain-containing sensor histidine kinase n=1 Tax=Motiliproteus sp. MSK22-1 TaxID=1897630 RepID=UPI000975BA29|nr:PAS domain S-box protein [Motiliproteus sp. MSK22-1]OMH38003.1 PAS domain-containing sensor histidine kinase [Motiliproteus sp. MSK22-1]
MPDSMLQQDDYTPLDRYRQLAEKSPDLISRHAPEDFSFIDVNPAVEKILGYAPEEIIGIPAYDLFHPEDANTWANRDSGVTYREGVYTSTYRFKCKSGSYVWLETTSRSIRNPETGNMEEIICVSRDVTERVQTEHTMTRLARVVEASSDLVMFSTEDHQINYLNEAAQKTMNIDKGRFPTLHLDELVSRETYHVMQEKLFPQVMKTGNWRGEIPLKPDSMEDRIAVIQQIIAHKSEEGDLQYFSIIGRDITDYKKAEEESMQHQLEMAHISRLLSVGEMASGLAHEINQPLAAILNYSRGSLRRIEDGSMARVEDIKKALELIARQAVRAADIIKRLRSFVKKTEYQRMEFQINDVCEEISQFLEQEAQNAGIRFIFRFDDNNPRIHADKVQIEQVILNLLRNAIESYKHSDQPVKTITIQTRQKDGQMRILIQDQGSGISSQQLENLFEPFFTTKENGLGMGLSISRTIIEAHGGRLWAESDGRSTTTFTIRLPLGTN